MTEIHNRIYRTQEQLGATAGNDPLIDRYAVGAIAAYNDLLNIEFDEVPNGD